MIVCMHCGLQIDPKPNSLGEIPVEQVVQEDDRIRLAQLAAMSAGIEPRHSISIASGFSIGYGHDEH